MLENVVHIGKLSIRENIFSDPKNYIKLDVFSVAWDTVCFWPMAAVCSSPLYRICDSFLCIAHTILVLLSDSSLSTKFLFVNVTRPKCARERVYVCLCVCICMCDRE